jgi:hypothetical protein
VHGRGHYARRGVAVKERSGTISGRDDAAVERLGRRRHLLPEDGAGFLPRVRALVQEELGWSDARWLTEEAAYRTLWRDTHGLPSSR